jgi:predicted acetyltransferase
MTEQSVDEADVHCRPAESWAEARRTAVTAGRAFEHRNPEGRFFHSRIVDAPGLPLENTLLVEVDDRLAGALQIYERQVSVGDGTVTAGAIGNVHVLPEFRGRGRSKDLLAFAHDFMVERGYAFSILGAGVPELYEKAGWTPLPYEATEIQSSDSISGETASGRFRSYDHPVDLPAVSECYREAHGQVTGRFRRPSWLWREWIFGSETEVLNPDQIRVYEEDGSVTGYIVVRTEDESAECLETAYTGSDEDTLVRSCWEVVADGVESVTWHPPFQAPLPDAVSGAVDSRREDTEMVCGYDWETLSALADEPVRDNAGLVELVTDGPWYWSSVDAF